MKNIRTFPAFVLAISVSACVTSAPPAPVTSGISVEDDRFAALYPSIAQFRRFVSERGDRLWEGLATAPFGMVLVDGDGEVLLCDDRVPAGFTAIGIEPVTGCASATGPSSWRQPNLRSAMAAFGPPSVIVVGTPEGTGQTMPEWLLTMGHEHFHQWQAELPDYYPRVEALGLSGGDQTGMWMLNYPFPYDDPDFSAAFRASSLALAEALQAPKGEAFDTALNAFIAARGRMSRTVSEKDWRYFEFQLWQEGVARWTEIALGEMHPDEAISSMAEKRKQQAWARLSAPQVEQDGRIAIYPYGYAEAALLEKISPAWRTRYGSVMALGSLFED